MKKSLLLFSICLICQLTLFGARKMDVSLLENQMNEGDEILLVGKDEENKYELVFSISDEGSITAKLIKFNWLSPCTFESFEIPSYINYAGKERKVTELGSGNYPSRYAGGLALDPVKIHRLVIPATIERINIDRPFYDANVKEFFVEEGNAEYDVVDDAVISKDGKTIVYFAKNDESDEIYKIPSSVDNIFPFSFFFVERTICLNNNFPVLPEYLFYECRKAPYLADNVKIIGEYSLAFPYYEGPILLPPNVEQIEDWGMYSGEPTFYSSLAGNYTSIVVPATVEKLGEHALEHGFRKIGPPLLGEIVFMSENPPLSTESSMTGWVENYQPFFATERMKIYVPRGAVSNYTELVENGTWQTINEILPQPDELRVSKDLGIGDWNEKSVQLSCRIYELGDAHVSLKEWSVNDNTIAEINPENGILTAKKPGKVEARLKITDNNGNEYHSKSIIRIDEKILNGNNGIFENFSDSRQHLGIWNIQGVRVNEDEKNLPNGLYIIDGKKVYIKH